MILRSFRPRRTFHTCVSRRDLTVDYFSLIFPIEETEDEKKGGGPRDTKETDTKRADRSELETALARALLSRVRAFLHRLSFGAIFAIFFQAGVAASLTHVSLSLNPATCPRWLQLRIQRARIY